MTVTGLEKPIPIEGIKRLFARMKVLGQRHCVAVYAEKGGWAGEDPAARLDKITERLALIEALRRGQRVSTNDDGSERTLTDEYGKLVCSVAIYGEDIGVCEGVGR